MVDINKNSDEIKTALEDFIYMNPEMKHKEMIEYIINDTFKILEYFENKKLKYNKNLLKEINTSIKLFELLNEYDSNKGNKKLAIRVKLLKTQYEKYKMGENIISGLKSFFDDYSGERVPSRENILTLASHNIKQILIIKDNLNRSKAKDIADSIVKTILNNDKKFVRKMPYRGISIEINNTLITMKYIYKD